MKKGLRIGVVPYLNAKPLIAGMEGGNPPEAGERPGVELRFAVPSQLPDLLEQGEVDVALVPSIEYLRGRPLFLIPGISIASRGAVKSVLLFLRVPRVGDIKRVALDESSLTSAILVRLILQERYGLEPSRVKYIPWSPGQNQSGIQADAVLVIGDNAMRFGIRNAECGMRIENSVIRNPNSEIITLDLGAEWLALTGLPFVYALWVTSKKELISSAWGLLHEARRKGLASLEDIACKEAKRLGLEPELCFRYLSENIYYGLGEEEIAGLRQFYMYALSMGLVSEGVNLDFKSEAYIREGAFQRADRI